MFIETRDDTSGALDLDLTAAIARALMRDRQACLARGRSFGWARSTDQFLVALEPEALPAAA